MQLNQLGISGITKDPIAIKFDPFITHLCGRGGKTLTLDTIWWALTNTWSGTKVHPLYRENEANWWKATIDFELSPDTYQKFNWIPKEQAWCGTRNALRQGASNWYKGIVVYAREDGWAYWSHAHHYVLQTKFGLNPRFDSADQKSIWHKEVQDGKEIRTGQAYDTLMWSFDKDQTQFEAFREVFALLGGGVLDGSHSRVGLNDVTEYLNVRTPKGPVPLVLAGAHARWAASLAFCIVEAADLDRRACDHLKRPIDPSFTILLDGVGTATSSITDMRNMSNALESLRDRFAAQIIVAHNSTEILAQSKAPRFRFTETGKAERVKRSSDE